MSTEAAYAEYPVAGTDAELVACTWQRPAETSGRHLVVPDGHVDVLWYSDGRFVVAGADTGPWHADNDAGVDVVGVRLHAAAAGAVLGTPADQVRDLRVPLGELGWSDLEAHGEALAATASAARRARLLKLVRAHEVRPDPLVRIAITRLCRRPGQRVGQLGAELGVGERHLHRRFRNAIGYGPKTYARVARLQRFVAAAGNGASLADGAHVAGYASQSHLSDEVRRLTGTTPVRFLEDRHGAAA